MIPYDPKNAGYILWIEADKRLPDGSWQKHVYKFNVDYIIAGGKIDMPFDNDCTIDFLRVHKIQGITPDPLTLSFNGGEEFDIVCGCNRYFWVKWYSYGFHISVQPVLDPDKLVNEFESIFENRGGEKVQTWIADLHRRIEIAVDRGCAGLSVIQGVTPQAGGWSACIVPDWDKFYSCLNDGIAAGALSPDDSLGWRLFYGLASGKAPSLLIPDKVCLERLLEDAREHGKTDLIRELATRLKNRMIE